MAALIGFSTVQAYLNAVAEANGGILSSPHRAFWNVSYDHFMNGIVPDVKCNGNAVPIINREAPLQSPFFVIMTTSTGWCGKRQMPGGGPFITDEKFQFTLPDGSTVTGKQIREDLATWLQNNCPENPAPDDRFAQR